MQTRWTKKALPNDEIVGQLVDELNLPQSLGVILAQRNIHNFDEAKQFFRPKFVDLHDPFLMKDMDLAVKRINQAIENQENILIYGDYDVDGTTSVSFMYLFLKQFYDGIHYYIPDRYSEGYGVSKQGVDFAIDNNFSLIIALDCGIKAFENVAYAKESGIDFIICDHHLPEETLPDAVAVLDPKRPDCNYPYKYLSGCGVGFKLAQAYCINQHIEEESLIPFLDFVVVSIAADIVPITGENRTLAFLGLKQLNNAPHIGFKHLIPNETHVIDITKIVFGIAPKINAAGRIKHATDAVELLITDNDVSARSYVSAINSLNAQRKDLDSDITEEALRQIRKNREEKSYSTVVYHPDWHKGVLGIVASRLTETYYRPTVVFTKSDKEELVASVRSVKNFDVYEVLSDCSDLLNRYGGHKYAAGLSMPQENLIKFKNRFEHKVKERISEAQLIPEILIDIELSFQEITPKFLRILQQLAPFGPENMKPVFLSKEVISAGSERLMGKENEHLKLNLYQHGSNQLLQAVGFGLGYFYDEIKSGKPFDLAYTIEENHWQGKVYTQLNIKDLRFLN